MTCYFFDLSDDAGFTIDDEGIELLRIEHAIKEAGQALSDAACDVLMRSTLPSFVAVEAAADLSADNVLVC